MVVAPPRRLSGWHVLIVEDEAMIAMLLADVLADAGCRVTVVHDGEAALRLAARHRHRVCHAAVVDLILPDISGHGVIAALRAVHPGLPVVVATGLPAAAEEIDASGPTAVLHKPFDLSELVATLAVLLDDGGSAHRPRAA
jgi:DNA-binding response OmpR family regulator